MWRISNSLPGCLVQPVEVSGVWTAFCSQQAVVFVGAALSFVLACRLHDASAGIPTSFSRGMRAGSLFGYPDFLIDTGNP